MQNQQQESVPDQLKNTSRGDVVTVDGTAYPVLRLNSGLRAIVTPDHPEVVDPETGDHRSLAYGAIHDDDDAPKGVMFGDDVPDDDGDADLTEGDLLGTYDDVTVREGDESGIYDHLPASDTRDCPECDGSGVWQFGDRDGRRAREVYRCTGDDCRRVWCFDRELPGGSTATVETFPWRGREAGETELSGVYRARHRHKQGLAKTQDGPKAWYTADEVAAFLNPKMNDDGEAERFGFVNVTGRGAVEWADDFPGWFTRVKFTPVTSLD